MEKLHSASASTSTGSNSFSFNCSSRPGPSIRNLPFLKGIGNGLRNLAEAWRVWPTTASLCNYMRKFNFWCKIFIISIYHIYLLSLFLFYFYCLQMLVTHIPIITMILMSGFLTRKSSCAKYSKFVSFTVAKQEMLKAHWSNNLGLYSSQETSMRISSSTPGRTSLSMCNLFTGSPTRPVYNTVSTLRITITRYSSVECRFFISNTTLSENKEDF